MRQHIKTLKRLTVTALEAMSDAQLEAAAGDAEIDWSGFSDAEVEAFIHDTAGTGLRARLEAATTYPEFRS